MSGAQFLVGDLHFGHAKVAELRGYSSTDAHDLALVKQWRKQVREGDTVYVLGDLSSGSRTGEKYALTILASLPGRKRLIAGNHDSVASIHRNLSPHIPLFNEVFERIGDFGRIRYEGREVLLSHYPYGDEDHTDEARYTQYRLRDEGRLLIHAHTHSTERFNGRQACVSWEAWNRLVNMGDLKEWVVSE